MQHKFNIEYLITNAVSESYEKINRQNQIIKNNSMEQSESFVFRWLSPLGLSVLLFLISGIVHILIGSLTPLMVNSEFGKKILIISNRTDTELFGTEPSELLRNNPELAEFRTLFFSNAGGSLIIIGIFIISLTWFGLKQNELWAFITLVITGLIVLPFWYLTFRQYIHAGISFTFSDLPPVFWIPATILLPAIILGWIGLR